MVSHPVANGVEPCSCRARYLRLQQNVNDADSLAIRNSEAALHNLL
eukprot:CAMPEP_0117585622 /NCGR_PEP_ID=MMETSP0784-20121206/68248_1 /TAXON_ID=39447 /ORGANISM="" /LENGTH=45 /DNA_ID= /DNA_START= /DNA_END= /DNA_ORIENTATION=